MQNNGIACDSTAIRGRSLIVDIWPPTSHNASPFAVEVKFFGAGETHTQRTKEAAAFLVDFLKITMCHAREGYVLLVTDNEMRRYLQDNLPEILDGRNLPFEFPLIHIAWQKEVGVGSHNHVRCS